MKVLILSLVIILSMKIVHSQEVKIDFEEFNSKDEVLSIAEKENKLIFIELHYKGCGYCELMKNKVFTSREVGDYINKNFVSLSLDINKDKLGKHFKNEFKTSGYPSLLFLNTNGNLVHKRVGYQNANDFLKTSSLAKDTINNHYYYENKIKSGTYSATDLVEYLAINKYSPIRDSLIYEYLKNDTRNDFYNEDTWKLISSNTHRYDSKWFSYILEHENDFRENISETKIDSFLIRHWSFMISRWFKGKKPNEKKILEMKNKLKELNHPLYDETIICADYRIAKDAFNRINNSKNWNILIERTKIYVNNSNDRFNFFNSAAWVIYQNHATYNDKESLQVAIKCANKSIANRKNYNNLDTLACLKYALNKKQEAKELLKEAILYAKNNNNMKNYRAAQNKLEKWNNEK